MDARPAAFSGRRRLISLVGLLAFGLSLLFIVLTVDTDALGRSWDRAWHDPSGILLAAAAYLAAFGLRALLWNRVLPGLSPSHALAAIHVSLAGNHILPFR